MSLKISLTNTPPYNYISTIANATYAALAAFLLGDIIEPGNGFQYICTAAGTSGSSPPAWPVVSGDTVTDGTVTWTCEGSATEPITLSTTIDNTSTPPEVDSSILTLYLVATSFRYSAIAITVLNEEDGMDWKLSVDAGVTWKDSLASVDIADMNALASDQITALTVKQLVANNKTVQTKVYIIPTVQVSYTESPV
jgi:hypothetical protein